MGVDSEGSADRRRAATENVLMVLNWRRAPAARIHRVQIIVEGFVVGVDVEDRRATRFEAQKKFWVADYGQGDHRMGLRSRLRNFSREQLLAPPRSNSVHIIILRQYLFVCNKSFHLNDIQSRVGRHNPVFHAIKALYQQQWELLRGQNKQLQQTTIIHHMLAV